MPSDDHDILRPLTLFNMFLMKNGILQQNFSFSKVKNFTKFPTFYESEKIVMITLFFATVDI